MSKKKQVVITIDQTDGKQTVYKGEVALLAMQTKDDECGGPLFMHGKGVDLAHLAMHILVTLYEQDEGLALLALAEFATKTGQGTIIPTDIDHEDTKLN